MSPPEPKWLLLVAINLTMKAKVISGVPEGSVLGSLRFLIPYYNIWYRPGSADGMFRHLPKYDVHYPYLYRVNSEADFQALQAVTDPCPCRQSELANTNNMTFNEDKFELLRCGPNTDIKNITGFSHRRWTRNNTVSYRQVSIYRCLYKWWRHAPSGQHHISAALTMPGMQMTWMGS